MIFIQIFSALAGASACFFVFMYIIRSLLTIRAEQARIISTIHSELNRGHEFIQSTMRHNHTMLLEHINAKVAPPAPPITKEPTQANPDKPRRVLTEEMRLKMSQKAKERWIKKREAMQIAKKVSIPDLVASIPNLATSPDLFTQAERTVQ